MMKNHSMNMLKKSDGAALVEFAIILPILLIFVFGVIEYGRVIHSQNIIANMSREGANLASRTSITANEIMDGIASTADPLDMAANGIIYITVIEGQDTPTVPRVLEQHRWPGDDDSGPSSRVWGSCDNYDTDGKCLNDLTYTEADWSALRLGEGELDGGERVFAVEVYYDLLPITTYVVKDTVHLRSQSVF